MPISTYNVSFDSSGDVVATQTIATPTPEPCVVQVRAKSLVQAIKDARVLYAGKR